jgi:hypothetical protein
VRATEGAEAELTDVLPSAAAVVGVPGFTNRLDLPPADGVVVLLVDGLGWLQLLDHAADAPYLAGLAAGRRPIRSGFPSTTPVSLASLGTGASPGRHGVVGFAARLPGVGVVDFVTWGRPGGPALLDEMPPERVQPQPTVYERATAAGIRCAAVAPAGFAGSGLTRAVLRGARFVPAIAEGDLVAGAAAACRAGDRLVYCYVGELDMVGHRAGPGSAAWRIQLRLVDQVARELRAALPAGCLLLVTADHGMTPLDPAHRHDVDTRPDLLDGVEAIAGEARARHVYCTPDRVGDRLAAWRDRFGEGFDIVTRDEAIAAGWFGPAPVCAEAAPRIGDLVAVSRGPGWLGRSHAEPVQWRFRGGHGSRTDEDTLVPLLYDH